MDKETFVAFNMNARYKETQFSNLSKWKAGLSHRGTEFDPIYLFFDNRST